MASKSTFCLVLLVVLASGKQIEEQLVEDLLKDYNTAVRPSPKSLKAVEITNQLYIMNIDELEAKRQYLNTIGFLGAKWKDPRLSWNPDRYGGIANIVLPPTKVWVPDTALINSVDGMYDEERYKMVRVRVNNNSDVAWEPVGSYTSLCRINIRYFPFDEQACEMTFGTWAYVGSQVNLSISSDKVDLNSYVPNVEWSIEDTFVWREDLSFSCCPESYPILHFRFRLKRKPLYFIINIVIPSAMLSVLVLLVFLLPVESGEKISLGVTILLAFSVFILMIAESVPRTSDGVPLIVFYLMFFMGCSTLALALSVMVLYLHHKNAEEPPPRWLLSVANFLSTISRCKQIKLTKFNEEEHEKAMSEDKIKRNTKANETKQEIAKEWREIARVFDRFFFLLFFMILLVLSAIILGYLPFTKANIDIYDKSIYL